MFSPVGYHLLYIIAKQAAIVFLFMLVDAKNLIFEALEQVFFFLFFKHF